MKSAAAVAACLWSLAAGASAAPPIEAYGELPDIIDVALSPDGTHFAYIQREGDHEYFVVSKVGGDVVGAARGEFKARSVSFPESKHAVLSASKTAEFAKYARDFESSGAISFNIETGKLAVLLRDTSGLHPAQTGLGKIFGLRSGTNDVFMPAYSDNPGGAPTYDLYAVDLDSGRGQIVAKGSPSTIDWIVDSDGMILGREEYDEKQRIYRILRGSAPDLTETYREKVVGLPSLQMVAVTPEKDALIVGKMGDGEPVRRLSRLGFDGSISAPLYSADNRDVETIYTETDRTIVGVGFSGVSPSYAMSDASIDAIMKSLVAKFPTAAVRLRDWTDDQSKLLLLIEGGAQAPAYYLLDTAAKSMVPIARRYKRIADGDVGVATPIDFPARDGRKIPAIVTAPPGVELGKKLPLIVLPHSEPDGYDRVGFDYLAQYFANRGYLVFQPNFRGSAGFGVAHLDAGNGEWGAGIQNDVTDGVNLLVKKGWADADRVCIVGRGFGGYSALAGGAFTPDLYKCVVAIAPVSDLNEMLIETVRIRGANSLTYAYWTKLIGDRSAEKEKIEAISPVNAASNFKAPVLLLHGNDDTVVPFNQSAKMEAALKKAGKPVRLVKLKGEDHWLSGSETRLQALKEIDAFVAVHIGRN